MTVFGYTFHNPALLQQALTHPSALRQKHDPHYERLEFLGDAVLGAIVSALLYQHFPDAAEGALAKRRAALVNGETLAMLARQLEMPAQLILGEGEEATGGRENDSTLENVFEALVAAIYLDSDFITVQQWVVPLFEPLLETMTEVPRDPKSTLQEWAQGRGLPLPVYQEQGREGPPHAPVFTIEVSVEGHAPVTASGSSKRLAEREAAAMLLAQLSDD